MSSWEWFKTVITIQIFYALAVTIIISTIPVADLHYLAPYQDSKVYIDMNNITSNVESTTRQQMGIALADIGSLVFISGNLLVTLMLNFLFAIPSMFTLLIQAVGMFIRIDSGILSLLKLFVGAIVTVLYYLSLLAFLGNLRSRAGIA